MRQCEKCKVYFEETTYSSFICNKCMPETDANPAQNTISDQANRHQLVSQWGSTTGKDAKNESIDSSMLLKTNFSNTAASFDPTTHDSQHGTDKNVSLCHPKDEKESSLSFQDKSFTKQDIICQMIVRRFFENFVMNNISQNQIPNKDQNVGSPMHPVNKIPDKDISDATNSWDSLKQGLSSYNSFRHRLFEPLHWKFEKQLANAKDSDKVIYPKIRLSPIQEETESDSDSVVTLAYNSPRQPSPNTLPDTSPIRKPESLTNDPDSDPDCIDVYDPRLPSGSKLFKCERCCLRFNAERNYLGHLEAHKLFQQVDFFACRYSNCDANFTSETEYLNHLNSHLQASRRSFENLPTYIDQENYLKRKCVDKDSGSEFESPRKRRDFSSKSCNNENYELNFKDTNQSSESPYTENVIKCHYTDCNETFLTQFELLSHLGTHFGPPYMCNFCTKSFSTLETYYEDQEIHLEAL